MRGDGARELGIGAHLSVEVGPDADHHRASARQEGADELLPALGVVALGVELLELIDDQEVVLAAVEVERRLGSGRDQAGRAGGGNLAGSYGGEHAGAQQRGLPASRCADDRQQPARPDARQNIAHQLLATEEETTIARFERRAARGMGIRRLPASSSDRGPQAP